MGAFKKRDKMKYTPLNITRAPEAPLPQMKLAALGGLYGLLLGSVFVLVAAYIDPYLHPELPLGINWDLFIQRFPLIVLGLLLTGALACWWKENWQGWLSGSLFLAALALTVALATSSIAAEAKFIVLLFIVMPMAIMSFPIIWAIRRLAEAHARALNKKWSAARILFLLIAAVALGVGSGYFMKMSYSALESTSVLQALLQDLARENNPINKTPGAREHADAPYLLYIAESETSTVGYDIRVEYDDGYKMLCTVVAYPGSKPYLRECTTGE
jgi:hypothetical protein